MDIRNDIINNAKSQSSLKELNTDVCIGVSSNFSELYLTYDNGEEQIITLSDEQRLHLIKMFTK